MTKKPRTGHLFKRWRGRYLPPESTVDGIFYLSYRVMGARTTVCLHTREREIADQLAADLMGRIKWTNREAYLKALVELGEQAKRELFGLANDTSPIPLETAWDEYLANRRRPQSGPATLRAYKGQWEAFRSWAPQRVKRLFDVTQPLAEQYVAEMEAKGRRGATLNKHLRLLQLMWRILCPNALNPWVDMHSQEVREVKQRRRLTLAECRKLYATATDELRLLVLLGYYSGMRLFDAVHIDREQVNASTKIITLTPRKTRRLKKRVFVPMLPELATAIAAAPASGPLLPALHAHYERDAPGVSRRWRDLVTACGMGTDVGYHSFRHTFISMMDEAGVPNRITDSVTGHATTTMHERYSAPDAELARSFMKKALPLLAPKVPRQRRPPSDPH